MRLHDYSVRAENVCRWPVFAQTARVYGVEVEVEPRQHSGRAAILNGLGSSESDFFCKTDGSLGAGGVEIVTVPGSLEWHREVFNWSAKLRPLLAIAMSGARTNRCGMHVHVNRRSLSKLTLGKLLLVINAPEFRAVIVALAQRPMNRWAAASRKEWHDVVMPDAHQADRYQALNLTRQTCEFRIFRGSLRADRILKNLETCDALIQWCYDRPAHAIIDPVTFLGYVMERARDWPNLSEFINETGLTQDLA